MPLSDSEQKPKKSSPLKENLVFLSSAISNYREIGMFFPSASGVADKIVSMVPMKEMRKVVEVGAGTGRLSRAILKQLPPDGRLVCVEKNKTFSDYLGRELASPRVTVLNSAAEDVLKDFPQVAEPRADCLVLSLAFKFAPEDLRRAWIDVCGALLKDNGYLIVQQVVPMAKKYLNNGRWRFERSRWLLDFPPFRVYLFRKTANGSRP